MIPDDAVEAAGGVLMYHQRKDITSCMCGWSELGKSHAVHQARLALEAAAPHLLHLAKREAWDANLEVQRLRAEVSELRKAHK